MVFGVHVVEDVGMVIYLSQATPCKQILNLPLYNIANNNNQLQNGSYRVIKTEIYRSSYLATSQLPLL